MSNTPLTFVIGDIHGMYDALVEVLTGIDTYIDEHDIKEGEYKIIFLGDYIDRGPDSFKVVDHIRKMRLDNPERVITLRGNHELMYLEALNGGMDDKGLFRYNGGTQTLESYGVQEEDEVPFSHKQFFRETRYSYEDDLRYYVHAGVNPVRKLSDQTNNDRVWIRELFLRHHQPFEKYIVHGHTPRFWDNYKEGASKFRLNLDFGAVYGGSLVCAIFNDTEVEPISYIEVKTPGRKGPL